MGPEAGYSGSIIGAFSQISSLIINKSHKSIGFIQELFAKIINLVDISDWGDKTQDSNFAPQYEPVSSGLDLDISDTSNSPPQIYALNPKTCRAGNTSCTAAEPNSLTLNGRNFTLADYDGNGIADEDNDNDKIPDPIIVYGAYTAILQFFAFADDNHMPIRRVMINWGDDPSGVTNQSKTGFYQNAKPLCAGTDEYNPNEAKRCSINNKPTQLTCAMPEDCKFAASGSSNYDCISPNFRKFGDSARACRSGYFEFIHNYTCTDLDGKTVKDWFDTNQITLTEKQRLASMGYTDNKKICVFQPKVQVLDNWGWCNGVCAKKYNGLLPTDDYSDGCYDKVGALDQCKWTNDTYKIDPWTKYKGSVIVLPL